MKPMTAVAIVLLLSLVLGLVAWAIAREQQLPPWGALAAAGATFIAVGGLGIAILVYLATSGPH